MYLLIASGKRMGEIISLPAYSEFAMKKWAVIWGTLGAAWMLVLLWAHSPRLVYLTSYPALWLTAVLVPIHPIHGSAFTFYAGLVLSSAMQWALVGLLFRAILHKISK